MAERGLIQQRKEGKQSVLAQLGWLVTLAGVVGVADALLLPLQQGQEQLSGQILVQAAFGLGVLHGCAGLLLVLAAIPLLFVVLRIPFLRDQLSDLIFTVLGLAGVAGLGYVLIRQPDWEALDERFIILGLILLAGLIGIRLAGTRTERQRILPGLTVMLGCTVVLLTGMTLMLWQPLRPATQLAMHNSITGAYTLLPLRRLFDNDRDGAPQQLCGPDCDCDDQDPRRHPSALDLMGDGLDQDCDGRDGAGTLRVDDGAW